MRIIFTVFLLALIYSAAAGQTRPISEQLADTAMSRLWVDSQNGKGVPDRWNYEQGVVLSGMAAVFGRRLSVITTANFKSTTPTLTSGSM